MIKLESGAILDKEFEPGDFVDGKKYHTRGLLETFHPCTFCLTRAQCKRVQYGPCIGEYLEKWKEVVQ